MILRASDVAPNRPQAIKENEPMSETKDTPQVLTEPLDFVAQAAEPGTRWRHVKGGGIYIVLDICIIEATMTTAVLYQGLKNGMKWVRPLAEFMDGRFTPLRTDP